MRHLRFVGVAEDGENLLLVAESDPDEESNGGTESFLLPIDERLRAASRGDRSRLGQIEIALESSLRPREIQTRIRAGESVDQVAAAAGVPAERVLRFAHPVIAEREQVCIEGRRTRIRRSESAPRLGEQVDDRLTRRGVEPSRTDWDAYRREDGTWSITLSWGTGRTRGRAQWTFDLGAHTVTPADDTAAELQAEEPRRRAFSSAPFVPEPEPGADATDAPARAPRPRPAASPPTPAAAAADSGEERPTGKKHRLRGRLRHHEEQLPEPEPGLGEAVPEPSDPLGGALQAPTAEIPVPVAPQDADPTPTEAAPTDAAPTDAAAADAAAAGTAGADPEPAARDADVRSRGPAPDEGSSPEPDRPEYAEPVALEDTAPEPATAAEEPAPQAKRGRRPSVPSWDDILFGTKGKSS